MMNPIRTLLFGLLLGACDAGVDVRCLCPPDDAGPDAPIDATEHPQPDGGGTSACTAPAIYPGGALDGTATQRSLSKPIDDDVIQVGILLDEGGAEQAMM